MTTEELEERLRTDGLVHRGPASLTPFGGGVSSDVWLVEQDGHRSFVVKRSVEKLRVKDDWRADPGRLKFEYRYLEAVGTIVPDAVPRLLSQSETAPYIAMEYLGDGFENWKTRMLHGAVHPADARKAGEILGAIHAATRDNESIRERFDTLPLFRQLRLDPYLMTTATRHPAVAEAIEEEAGRLASSRICLVHGDYSPKNMLVSEQRFVVLDCETAWCGDPAFDLAFLLNHLHLKALYHAPRNVGLGDAIDTARTAYFARAVNDSNLDRRTARLLLMLLLARVDGKSPVEYLDAPRQETVRAFVLQRLNDWNGTLSDLTAQWLAVVFAAEH